MATATRSVREEVTRSLGMEDCVCVSVTPERPNIYYEVKQRNDIETDFADLVHLLKEKLVE